MSVDEPLLDHLVYAAIDPAATVDRFASALGVTPAEGGRHLGRGTRNYLLGLTDSAYLEIIGLDVEHPADPGAQVPFGVDQVTEDGLLTFAIHPADIDAAVSTSSTHGADHGPAAAMSRRTATGDLISWRIASAVPLPYDGLAPFVIDWGSTPHPALSGLPRVELASFSVTTPDPQPVRALYGALGLAVSVSTAPRSSLSAVVIGPGGTLTL